MNIKREGSKYRQIELKHHINPEKLISFLTSLVLLQFLVAIHLQTLPILVYAAIPKPLSSTVAIPINNLFNLVMNLVQTAFDIA
jgi:hypothetical protein